MQQCRWIPTTKSSPASHPNPCPHPYKRSLRARKPNRPVLALLPSSKNASLCLFVHILCPAALPRSRQVYDRHMVPSTCSCFSAFMPSSDPWPCCQRSASRSVHSRCGQRAYQANKPCLAQHRCTPWIRAWRWLPPRGTLPTHNSLPQPQWPHGAKQQCQHSRPKARNPRQTRRQGSCDLQRRCSQSSCCLACPGTASAGGQ